MRDKRQLAHLELPLRRLRSCSERRNVEDQLVDCVIGLERLLSWDTPALESTFRFKLRGAALLSPTFGAVSERKKLMSNLYSARSKIVHGAVEEIEIALLCEKAEAALKDIIKWYLSANQRDRSFESIKIALDHALIAGGADFANRVKEK